MAESLEDLLRACTVRVNCGNSTGAGFFVAPGKVITCVHVISGGADVTVRWERDNEAAVEFPVAGAPLRLADRGRPIEALDEYPDIAVLDVEGLDGHPCVRVDTAWPRLGDTFQAYGYPREGGTLGLTAAMLGYRGKHGNEPTAYLDLASDTVKPGMSGAPVLNLRTGGVCGVVVASKNAAQPDGALVVPWSVIASDLSDLLAANKVFHEQNPAWNAVAAVPRKVPGISSAVWGPEQLTRLYEYLDLRRFTGRRQLITQIRDFIDRNDHGWVVLQGEAGVGKSALAAHLAWNNGWFFHSTWFQSTRDPEKVRKSLAAQLIAAFGLDERCDPDGAFPPESREPKYLADVLEDAAAKRDRGEAAGQPIVLVIDTLNDIDPEGQNTALELPTADELPHKVFIIATRRPGYRLSAGSDRLILRRAIKIDEARLQGTGSAPDGSNTRDMHEYVRSLFDVDDPRFDRDLFWILLSHHRTPTEFTGPLVTQCAGVWIYLKYVLDDVRAGRPPTDVVSLPQDLRGYYLDEIRHQQGKSELDHEKWRRIRRPVLATLAALRRPATVEELARLAGIDGTADREELRNWLATDIRALLHVDKDSNGYEVRHQSLRDMMAAPSPPSAPDDDDDDPLYAELPDALRGAHAGITARLMPPGPPGQRDWTDADEYVRDALAEHAANAGRLDELVIDPGFLLICQPSSVLLRRNLRPPPSPSVPAVSAYEEALNEWAGLPADDESERAWRLHVWARKTGASELAAAAARIAGRTPVIEAAAWTGTTHRLMQHGHIGSVNAIMTLQGPDGRPLLASGGSDGLVRFWDPATAKPDGDPLEGDGTGVLAVAAVPLPDQRILLATGDRDGVVRLWDAADRTPVNRPIAAHRDAVHAITVVNADDQTLLVTCGRDGLVRLWNPATGTLADAPAARHGDCVTAAVPAGGAQLLAIGSRDGTVRLWNPWTGRTDTDPVPCGNRGVTALAGVTLSANRAVLAVGGADGTVWIWDPQATPPDGEPLAGHAAGDPTAAHDGAVTAITVAWLAGRPLFASVGEDRVVRMWDPATGKAAPFSFKTHANLAKTITAVSLPDGRTLLAVGGNDHKVELRELYESAAGTPVDASPSGHDGPVNAIGVAKLGDRTVLVSGSRDRTVRLWDPETGTPADNPLAGRDRLSAVAAIPLPGGQTLIATRDVDGVVRLWNPAATPPTSRRLKSNSRVSAIAAVELPGHVLLATGEVEGTVRLWDLDGEEEELVGVIKRGHTNSVNAITSIRLPAPDGRTLLATGSSDGTVRRWNSATCAAIGKPLTGRPGEKIQSLAAVRPRDASGRTLFAAGSARGKVYVWEGDELVALLQPQPRQAGAVTALATVELRDRTLLAAGGDRVVRLWNLTAEKPTASCLTGHGKPVNAIASLRLPGGPTLLATGGDDSTILIWKFD